MAEKLAKFTTMTKGTAEDYQIIAEASMAQRQSFRPND